MYPMIAYAHYTSVCLPGVSSYQFKGFRCLFEHQTLRLLLSTGWSKERIRA